MDARNQRLGYNRAHLPGLKIEHPEHQPISNLIVGMLRETTIAEMFTELPKVHHHFVGGFMGSPLVFNFDHSSNSNIELCKGLVKGNGWFDHGGNSEIPPVSFLSGRQDKMRPITFPTTQA